MNSIAYIRQHILAQVKDYYALTDEVSQGLILAFNQDPKFGDLCFNAAFIVAKSKNTTPQSVAPEIAEMLACPIINEYENKIAKHISSVTVAGNGFLNISLTQETWRTTAHELAVHPSFCFKMFDDEPRHNYLIEFVSANPTGPLSLAHGRNAIIGDTLARVLLFLGHKVTKEFYINDAGQQIKNLGMSLKTKVYQLLKINIPFHENQDVLQYDNEYMQILSEKCVQEFGEVLRDKSDLFFEAYAKNYFLLCIKEDLESYRVSFDNWVSEAEICKGSRIETLINNLNEKGFIYEEDGAKWLKSTVFGDDKDRVLVRGEGTYTYVVPDLVYHKDKFDRNFDFIIDILGQDHHGYDKRLSAGMQALGYSHEKLKVLFYQLVFIKQDEKLVKMSKRMGTFKSLRDVVMTVGVDVARFFYLNKKIDAHLNFDLELALTHTSDNPVYYLQYAYVRANSILSKALSISELKSYVEKLINKNLNEVDTQDIEHSFLQDEISLLKKICSLRYTLYTIAQSYQSHLLANYSFELAQAFHVYYNNHRIINEQDIKMSASRLLLVAVLRNTIGVCLDLLGLSKPDKM